MSKMNVLIVDDHEPSLTLYRQALRKLGELEAFCFQSSKEALTWASAHEVRLAIVDFHMPSPNGLEFTHALRSLKGKDKVPVIMITANKREDLRAFASTNLGIDAFAVKPVSFTKFTALAKQLLEEGRSETVVQTAEAAKLIIIGADTGRPSAAPSAAFTNSTFDRLCKVLALRNLYLRDHSLLTALFAGRIASVLEIPDWEVKLIESAARLHDIGMIGTPDGILSKVTKLDDREWKIVKEHPKAGLEMLKNEKNPLMVAASVMAMTHHERIDGSGYPNGLQGSEIPLYGRIVAVADAFAAMLSKRPYRKAFGSKYAYAELKEHAGIHFDAEMVNALASARISDIFSKYGIK